jgi:hypothetical protein
MLVPKEDHSKLWSCVSLSISNISPLLFIVHQAWIFNGAMQTLGILLILSRSFYSKNRLNEKKENPKY